MQVIKITISRYKRQVQQRSRSGYRNDGPPQIMLSHIAGRFEGVRREPWMVSLAVRIKVNVIFENQIADINDTYIVQKGLYSLFLTPSPFLLKCN